VAKSKAKSQKSPLPKDIQIGQRIRAQRLNSGMSQTDLADRLGVTFQQVQKYEKGVNRVGAGRLEQIAEAIGVTPAFFFDGAGDRVSKSDAEAIDSGIGLLRRQGALRVLKAYDAMSPKHRQLFMAIGEIFSGNA
jgi:transcriptional regulator with XRE-family HTH domain